MTHLDPFMSRRISMNGPVTELRGNCPRLTVDVLDAVSGARGMSRIDLVNELLGEWAARQLHEASLIHKVTRGNPEVAEQFGL
jgi:hypothetical protein